MITLTHLEQLATVPVPEPLKTFLHDQLITQPFGTLKDAQAAWQLLDNRLILLDPHDDPYTHPDLPSQSVVQQLAFPEMILCAPEDHVLILIIIDQAGSGLYLLYPKTIQCPELQALARWADLP
jgi:hypothetical protein